MLMEVVVVELGEAERMSEFTNETASKEGELNASTLSGGREDADGT